MICIAGMIWLRVVTEIADRHKVAVRAVISGEAFLTMPGAFSALVSDAVVAETGITPDLSTTGGTSDCAVFCARYVQ